MIKYHIRLEPREDLDRADNECFLNRVLTEINACDYYKSIKKLTRDDLNIIETCDGNKLISFDFVINKTQNKTKVLDKLLSLRKSKSVKFQSLG